MEEKKVCTCCESKEKELEELQDEETKEAAGGVRNRFWYFCKHCGNRTYNVHDTRRPCTKCGKPMQ